MLRRRHVRAVHQVSAVSSRPESHRPRGHSSTLRGGHHPIRMSSDGDLRQWDTVLRRNVSHPPPGIWDCTSADTAIHAPGEPRGKDEQNTQDHGGPVLRGRSKEVGHPSSGADVRPQHLTPALLNFGRELVVPNTVQGASGNAAANWPADTAADEVKEADDAVHHSERLRLLKDTFELVRVNLARTFAKQSKYYNLRHREWRCHPGDRVLKRDHPLSSGAKGFAAKLVPKYSGPYTVTNVLSPVVYNLQSPSGQKILRAHIKDLKPYQMPEPPADLANICRMPNQRIPPPPNGLQSVRQQLHR
jgi:hypothetical protein